MQRDLIDRYQMMVVPVFLGCGKRFFRDGRDTTTLSLTDIRTTGAGVAMLTYDRAANDGDRSSIADRVGGDWWLRRTVSDPDSVARPVGQ
jgi:hypothetical protein